MSPDPVDPNGSGRLQQWRPGYFVERTSQAWIRTALSVLAVGGAVARLGVEDGGWWAISLGLVAVVIGGCLIVASGVRWRRTRLLVAADLDPRSVPTVVIAVASVFCTGLATLALIIAAALS
ncbi:MAG: YidH family protein [Nocardioidaceae bacterium]